MMGRNMAVCPKTPALVTSFRRMPMAILETPAMINRPPSTVKTAVVGPSPAKTGFWMFSETPKAQPEVAGSSVGPKRVIPDSTSFAVSMKENIAAGTPAKRVCFEPLPLQKPRNVVNKWTPKASPQQEVPKQQKSKPDPKRLRIITGSVEHILKLSRSAPEESPLVELYANILSVKPGGHDCERILLLRNRAGPVIQGVFYEIDFRMPVVGAGDLVRCVGRLTGGSRLQILKITAVSEEDERMGHRLQVVSGFVAGVRR